MTMNRKLYFLIILSMPLFFVVQGQETITLPLRFDNYYSYDQIVSAMKLLNKTYPELTNLEIVGKSDEGRDIYLITIKLQGLLPINRVFMSMGIYMVMRSRLQKSACILLTDSLKISGRMKSLQKF
jgi:hypothetical protein